MSLQLSSYLVLGFCLFCSSSVAQHTLTVAAASDLTNLEPELARHSSVRFVTGASATLAQQIENGAPYDVFLSANAQFVDELVSKRKIEPNSVITYAVGRVGVLWRDAKPHDIKDLEQNWVRFVALPNPKLAPYGVAAQQALEHAGIWEFVSQKAVYGENVRQALQLFESGNADVVLTSAALLQGKNPQLIPSDWHQPITQKAGIVSASPNRELARKFLDFLLSPAGQAIFAKFGFVGAGHAPSGATPWGAPGRKPPEHP